MNRADIALDVRAQYDAYPYPARDPAEESRRLLPTWLDALPMINHYGFAGRQSFRRGFRALVAGGGTGDATVFLAEQLRHTDAQVVHLDVSRAGSEVARARAARRGLTNITWVDDSILALRSLGLGPFDYVNCVGVLQLLPDPDEGLRALLSATAESGVLGVMVPATYGRAGVAQMRSLLRLLTAGEPTLERRIATARDVLQHLPRTNWFARSQDLHSDHRYSDAGLVDLLLSPDAPAYSVEEVHAWFEDRHGLSVELTDNGRGHSPYEPAMVVGAARSDYLAVLQGLPRRRRDAVSELLGGTLIKHSFYAVRGPSRRAPYGDPDYVPFFFFEAWTGADVSALLHRQGTRMVAMQHAPLGIQVDLDSGTYTKFVLKYIDGKRSFGEIFSLVRQEPKFRKAPPDTAALFADFRPMYEFLTGIDRLLLRHRSIEPLPAPL